MCSGALLRARRCARLGVDRFRGGRRIRFLRLLLGNLGSEFHDTREQRIDCRSHFGVTRPLPLQKLLEHVHGFEANIDDFGVRLNHSVAQVAKQVFNAMGHRGDAMEADLRRRPFHRMHRAEQAVDVVRIRIGFESQQAFRHGLQVLFGFRYEEFENFVRDVSICRQRRGKGRASECVRRHRLGWFQLR